MAALLFAWLLAVGSLALRSLPLPPLTRLALAPACGAVALALMPPALGLGLVTLLPAVALVLCWKQLRELDGDRWVALTLVGLVLLYAAGLSPHDGPACLRDGRQSYVQLLDPGLNPFYRVLSWVGLDFARFQAGATLLSTLVLLPLVAGVASGWGRLAALGLCVAGVLGCRLGLPDFHCILLRPTGLGVGLALAGALLLPWSRWRAGLLLCAAVATDPAGTPAGLGLAALLQLQRPAVRAWLAARPGLASALLVLVRVAVCFQTPTGTTDCFRHLGFSSHFWDLGVGVYATVPRNFAPERWAQTWPDVPYIYPPVTLLFFAACSGLGLGTVGVRLILTGCEFLVSRLFARHNRWWGPLYFASPMSVWWCSHEGQYEPLVALLLALSLSSGLGGRWARAGVLFALAVQAKQLAVLALPWLLWRGRQRFVLGVILGALPCVPVYLTFPDLLGRPHLVLHHGHFNPYAGEPVALALLVLSLVTVRLATVGWLALWAFAQLSPVVMPWYLLVGPAMLLAALDRPRLVTAFLLLWLLLPWHDHYGDARAENEPYRFRFSQQIRAPQPIL